MARGCNIMANNQEQDIGELDVPVIEIPNGTELEDHEINEAEEDDDAAVYLQELGINFGITARSKGKTPGLHTLSRDGSAVSSGITSVLSRQKSSRTLVEVVNRVTQGGEGHLYRLLSAKRNHVQQLNSDIIYLQKRIKELQDQNRLVVRLCKRQEAALQRYQDMRTELPHIIEAHKIEINVLQEKLRRSTEVNRRNSDKLKMNDGRIMKLTEELSRLRDLSKRRNLPERDQLNKKLSTTNQSLQEREKEVEEMKRRIALMEKSLRQQVQAEVGRHRATAKKLYTLQCEHTTLQDTLKEKEKELGALQQYRSRAMRTPGSSSISTTATSSRSGSVSARHVPGRTRGIGSAVTTTSGIVSNVDGISTSDSRGSLPLDGSARLPPISADPRKRNEVQVAKSPEVADVPTRRSRIRTHVPGKLSKDCTEDRRPGRLKRGRRSPRPSTDDDSVPTPTITPTPSPSSTPEPLNQQQSESNGEATDGSTVLPGHTDQRRRQRLAATLQESNQQSTDERSGDEATEKPDLNVKPKPLNRQYSLIENYPPRERTVLTGCSSGGSDSGSGLSPPPIKPTPFIRHTNTQGPSRLTRLDSALPPTTPQRRQQTTVAASDLRTVSSLSEVDAKSNPKPTSTRTAITP